MELHHTARISGPGALMDIPFDSTSIFWGITCVVGAIVFVLALLYYLTH